jgi:DNA-binding transcriptional LysR family regulator
MTKEDILAFRAVARHLNFTRAAETLFITQSSLSKKIARLEKELGVTLLTRTKQSVQLTNAGMVLYQASEGFLQHGQMIREAMRRVSEVGYLTLRIGILGTVLGRKFLPVLQQFQK